MLEDDYKRGDERPNMYYIVLYKKGGGLHWSRIGKYFHREKKNAPTVAWSCPPIRGTPFCKMRWSTSGYTPPDTLKLPRAR